MRTGKAAAVAVPDDSLVSGPLARIGQASQCVLAKQGA